MLCSGKMFFHKYFSSTSNKNVNILNDRSISFIRQVQTVCIGNAILLKAPLYDVTRNQRRSRSHGGPDADNVQISRCELMIFKQSHMYNTMPNTDDDITQIGIMFASVSLFHSESGHPHPNLSSPSIPFRFIQPLNLHILSKMH